jgi:uncharacterized membrane protein YphA (DoxX/SURF4 family)
MEGAMKRTIAVDIICYLLIFLLVYTATSKLLDFELFRVQLGKSPLISSYAGLLAWVVPILELLIALMLSLGRLRLIGLAASFTLMLIFTGYVWFILAFSPNVPCSCGGVINSMGWSEHLIFNIGFTTLAALGVIMKAHRTSSSTLASQ